MVALPEAYQPTHLPLSEATTPPLFAKKNAGHDQDLRGIASMLRNAYEGGNTEIVTVILEQEFSILTFGWWIEALGDQYHRDWRSGACAEPSLVNPANVTAIRDHKSRIRERRATAEREAIFR
ncbi:hypothetical protein LTR17_020964 [Elasticomyces elasticus]|nr:hypothetical protein LTR17_020964 [Elasticomyces elasticus]